MTNETLPKAIDADRLTGILQRSGVLGDGRVRDIAVESAHAKQRSRVLRLRPTYDGDGPYAPSSIILKTGLSDGTGKPSPSIAAREVAFYGDVASAMSARLVPRCFDAAWDASTGTWHLLLEDLTDSHFIATTWPLPPTLEQCESIIRARAHFHAEWWDDPRLGTFAGSRSSGDATSRHLKRLAEQFAFFMDHHREHMPPERSALYERFLDQAPSLLARYHARRDLTVVHGDAHVWNCFLPRNPQSQDVRFFDWEAWTIGAGTGDLAYMMAVHWYPDRRRRMERPLLDAYHRTLSAHGIEGYDRAALDDDYRLSALWMITRPVLQAAHDIPARVWWNNLERIFLAVDDLGCRDLLA